MRDQIETGLNLSERLMERRLLISCGDKSASLPAFMKKVFTDCNARFEQADFSCMHHVGFLDWTKFGRLTMAVIDEQARWAAKVLDLNDNYSTVIMICPILAGEGVLHGTRGEHRRIEDKLLSMGLELKNIQVCFDVAQFPCALPGWMVVKDSTLGARQGTLYKVPRNSDRDVKDQNLFAKSDYWNLLACRATAPLPISEYQTPESGTFLSHEQGRSLTDKEETAQWVASGACIRSILESTMSRVSSLKGQSLVLHHATPYEGTFEKVAYDLMVEHEETTHIACYSELQNPQVFSFVATQVKDRLLEDWKKTQGLMIMKPQFTASADFSGITEPKRPSLKLCSMTEGGNLEIPRPIRDKFLSDPIRSHLDYYPDWRVRLANFDNVFKPSSQGEAPAPKPGAENADLSVEGANANATTQGSNSGAGKASEPPPSMSQEDFQKAYPEPTLTISLTVAGGQSITCTYAKGKVVLEETGSRGAADSDAMTIFDLIVMLEKRGLVDLTLTGHKFERPPAVKRGESEDSMVFNHEAFSVYKPNPVQQKNVKSSNGFLAGSNCVCLAFFAMLSEQHPVINVDADMSDVNASLLGKHMNLSGASSTLATTEPTKQPTAKKPEEVQKPVQKPESSQSEGPMIVFKASSTVEKFMLRAEP
ncbi:unnamed protein product, partial [Durusdinium trenchii]